MFNLDTPEGLALLKKTGVTIKEAAKFKYKISFRVQHDIVAGIKFVNKVCLEIAHPLMIHNALSPPTPSPLLFLLLLITRNNPRQVKTTLMTDKEELVIGSYPPSSTPHVFEFPRFDYVSQPG